MAESVTSPPGGDQNFGPALLAIAVASSTLAVLATIIRVASRTWIVGSVGADDYTIAVAAVRLSDLETDFRIKLIEV